MKKVLITGATGFLGEYLIREFVPEYAVYALGRNEKKRDAIEAMGAVFYPGDFTDQDQCEPYFRGVDYVIHAGALSTVWGTWTDFYDANVSGTRHIAQLCRKHAVKRLIYVSSPSIYSERKDRLDIREDEFDHQNQLNDYIRSKIMAEKLLLEEFSDLYTVIIRPRGLIGKGDSSLVPRLLEANRSVGIPLFNHGQNLVDLTCVENVAHALRLCVERDEIRGEAFNITNGEPTAFKALLDQFLVNTSLKAKYLALPLPLMYGFAAVLEACYRFFGIKGEPKLTRYTVCTLGYSQTLNIEKAQKMLGYRPHISLREGIDQYGA